MDLQFHIRINTMYISKNLHKGKKRKHASEAWKQKLNINFSKQERV